MKDLIIIGAGPAGMTAAQYGARCNMNLIVLESQGAGGQMATTPIVENYPGLSRQSGWEISQVMEQNLKEQDIRILYEEVKKTEKTKEGFLVKTDSNLYEAKTVIIANGVKRRTLDCKGEEQFAGRGISWCAVCDGNFYKGKRVAVIGGGSSAVEDAIHLSFLCEKVYLIHRRDNFRAAPYLLKNLQQAKNIKLLTPFSVEEIYGTQKVEGLRIKHMKSGEITTIQTDGVFEAIGLIADNEKFSDLIKIDENGYILTNEECETTMKGIFAAGDTRKKFLRQIVTAVADGAISAQKAFAYLRQ